MANLEESNSSTSIYLHFHYVKLNEPNLLYSNVLPFLIKDSRVTHTTKICTEKEGQSFHASFSQNVDMRLYFKPYLTLRGILFAQLHSY